MSQNRRPATKRRRPRRRREASARNGRDVDLVVSVVRLGVGAWSLGADQLARRVAATRQTAHGKVRSPAPHRRRRKPSRAVTLGWIAAGIAVESAEMASRWLAAAAAGERRTRALARSLRRAPGAGAAARLVDGPVRRYRSSVAALQERGRSETRDGRRMAERFVRDTTRESVRDIAESAVQQVAHSPEVAALVRAQSTGLATGTILEVRANSEQADDRLERRVRSWLHRPERTPDGATTEPSSPSQTPA